MEDRIEKVSTSAGYFNSSGLDYLGAEKIDGFIPSLEQVAKEIKKY